MPIQSPAWNDFLSCPVCCLLFDGGSRPPISLGCGHTLCAACLHKLHTNHCPFDQTEMNVKFSELPINRAILSLMTEERRGYTSPCSLPPPHPVPASVPAHHHTHYLAASESICQLAHFLRPFSSSGSNLNLNSSSSSSALSRSMQRKLVTLINCQLLESEGRARAIRGARSLGERTVTELILHHQNHHQLSANLWAAVRARGCQFLGPAMQEEVIRLVLLALEDGSALSRKVLVMFVVQRLEPHFPQASKTSIGHVVQLLYRASCFKVSKRERDSSLMQLKEEFRCYDSLRREHDTQIVQIATEAGLRIAPDQWSSLLYGDVAHKSHMQSIMDKLQTPQSFAQSVNELLFALHRTGDPGQLTELWPKLEVLAGLDPGGSITASNGTDLPPSLDTSSLGNNSYHVSNSDGVDDSSSSWQVCSDALSAVQCVLAGLVHFLQHYSHRRLQEQHRYRPRQPPRQHLTRAPLDDTHRLKYAKTVTSASGAAAGGVSPGGHFNKADDLDSTCLDSDRLTCKSSGSPLSTDSVIALHSSLQSDCERRRTISEESQSNSLQLNQMSAKVFVSKALGIPSHSQPSPYLPVAPTPGMVPAQAGLGISQNPYMTHHSATIYTGPSIPTEFSPAYQTYNQPGPLFGTPAHHQVNVGTGASMYPQAPTPMITAEIYPSNAAAPQTLLVNSLSPLNHHVTSMSPHMYNVMPPAMELICPINKGGGQSQLVQALPPLQQHVASMPPPVMHQTTLLTPYYDLSPNIVAAKVLPAPPSTSPVVFPTSYLEDQSHSIINSTVSAATFGPDVLKKKSLSELQEIKENIVTRLKTIVGTTETEKVEEHIAKNQEHIPCVISQASIESARAVPEYSSTYSIWTSGANFYSIARSCIEKEKNLSETVMCGDGEIIYADTTTDMNGCSGTGKPGSFGKPPHTPLTSARPIQVSASNDVSSTTTSTLGTNYPLLSLSPMPHQAVLYPSSAVNALGYQAYGLYSSAGLENSRGQPLNTIHHGIIDPPHLRMSLLDPSGARPSDPLDQNIRHNPGCKEELQRQQLNAVTDGMDPFNSTKDMPEDLRLKQELSFVMHGIQEKLNVKENLAQKQLLCSSQEEDIAGTPSQQSSWTVNSARLTSGSWN